MQVKLVLLLLMASLSDDPVVVYFIVPTIYQVNDTDFAPSMLVSHRYALSLTATSQFYRIS